MMAETESIEQALSRAQIAAKSKRLGEAGGICQDILRLTPNNPGATALLGIIHAQQSELDTALRLLEAAVSDQPNVAAWHANLCNLYRITNQIDKALISGREAVRLDAGNPDSLVTLSLVFVDLDDRGSAIAALLRALGLNDQHADAHLALAQILLAQGEFDSGWMEYEWRNRTEAGRGQLPRITSAPWSGMHIPGGKVLLIGDQGYGDTIQFSRFVPLVAQRCEEVILGCSAEMTPLLGRLPGVSKVFHRWNEIPGHAAYCRLSSLGLIFRTNLDTLPRTVPYLRTDPDKVKAWGNKVRARARPGVPCVGLVWSGRSTHPNDRRRSLSLERMAPIITAAPISFVCLQRPIPPADFDYLATLTELIDFSRDLQTFDDTAALIENLDLVISVDTAVGHLAGALGKPTWIMLPKASDWRWLLNRSDSPWYPTVRLFRQSSPGAWEEVIEEVATALQAYATCHSRPTAARDRADRSLVIGTNGATETEHTHAPPV